MKPGFYMAQEDPKIGERRLPVEVCATKSGEVYVMRPCAWTEAKPDEFSDLNALSNARAVLDEVMDWIINWDAPWQDDPEWQDTKSRVDAVLTNQ